MTVPSTTRRAGPFTGTGALVAYPFTFKVFAKQDLAVTIADSNGLETDLVLDSTFTVTLNVDQEATPGGTVNYAVGGVAAALPSGYTLVVTGDGLEFEQTADLPQGGNFSPVVIENALDRVVMLLQRLWDGVRRSMRLPDTASDSVSTVLPTPTANNFIGWDGNGTALRNVDPNTLATVVAFAAWQSQAFSGDGVTTQFTLSSDPGNVNNLDVVVGAVPQRNNVDFTLSGTTLTFDVAPANGLSIFCRWGQALPEGTSTLQARLADPTSASNGYNMVAVTKTALEAAAVLTVTKPQYQPGDIRRYGAISGSAAYESVNNTALQAAIDSGHAAYVPEGSWYYSTGLLIGANEKLVGAGKGKTTLIYSGSGAAVTLGNPTTAIALTYNVEAGGFTVLCTNRGAGVSGVLLRNAVYFRLYDITAVGSGNPNSANPTDNALYGSGLEVTDNSILGTIKNVNCRIWKYGKYFWTRSTSTSNWSAAIDVCGGENGNNMYGLVIGDPAVAFASAVGVRFQEEWFQGNYTTGVKNYSGYNTVFDSCYWEGNANYDYDQGGGAALPVSCVVTNSTMSTEGIGTTNYGTFPYLSKVRITNGFNTIVNNNDMAVSTSIPLVIVGASAEETKIRDNRLNSSIATTSRINNSSTTTYTSGNSPENATVAIGSFTRNLAAASGSVQYTGLGFKPTSIEFIGAVSTQEENSTGWAALTNGGIVSRCIHRDAAEAQLFSSDAIRLIRSSAGNEQKAVVASFDLDGFTLSWTLVGSPPANDMTVQYIARR